MVTGTTIGGMTGAAVAIVATITGLNGHLAGNLSFNAVSMLAGVATGALGGIASNTMCPPSDNRC